jgi:hypothetical protein
MDRKLPKIILKYKILIIFDIKLNTNFILRVHPRKSVTLISDTGLPPMDGQALNWLSC